jgi:hypothetical protein
VQAASSITKTTYSCHTARYHFSVTTICASMNIDNINFECFFQSPCCSCECRQVAIAAEVSLLRSTEACANACPGDARARYDQKPIGHAMRPNAAFPGNCIILSLFLRNPIGRRLKPSQLLLTISFQWSMRFAVRWKCVALYTSAIRCWDHELARNLHFESAPILRDKR